MRLAYALSELGHVLIKEDDGAPMHYRVEKAHNRASVLGSGTTVASVKALAKLVDPSIT